MKQCCVLSLWLPLVSAVTTCLHRQTVIGGRPAYVTTSELSKPNGTCDSDRWCLVITKVKTADMQHIEARCWTKEDRHKINCDAHLTNGLRWTATEGGAEVGIC